VRESDLLEAAEKHIPPPFLLLVTRLFLVQVRIELVFVGKIGRGGSRVSDS